MGAFNVGLTYLKENVKAVNILYHKDGTIHYIIYMMDGESGRYR